MKGDDEGVRHRRHYLERVPLTEHAVGKIGLLPDVGAIITLGYDTGAQAASTREVDGA